MSTIKRLSYCEMTKVMKCAQVSIEHNFTVIATLEKWQYQALMVGAVQTPGLRVNLAYGANNKDNLELFNPNKIPQISLTPLTSCKMMKVF